MRQVIAGNGAGAKRRQTLSGFAYCSEEPWVRCLNRTRTQAAKDWSGKVGIRASGSGQTEPKP